MNKVQLVMKRKKRLVAGVGLIKPVFSFIAAFVVFAAIFIARHQLVSAQPYFNAETVAAEGFQPFGTITLNVDSIAFWEAPNDSDSLMFVTSKGVALVEVWKYPYNTSSSQLAALTHSCINGGSNGVFVDQEADLLYVSIRSSTNVCVFDLPSLSHVQTITSGVTYATEPNLAMMKNLNGQKSLYVSDDTVVYRHDVQTGNLTGSFNPITGLEAMAADNKEQILYIPDENGRSGVYAYDFDGNQKTQNGISSFGSSSIFDSDEEGIIIYTCPSDGLSDNGQGLIVVSDQINNSTIGNDYEFFDRQTWQYLGKLKLKLPSGAFVYNTDGLGSTQQSSAKYPTGLFTAIQNDRRVAGISWQKILSAANINCSSSSTTPTSTPTTAAFTPTATPSSTSTPTTTAFTPTATPSSTPTIATFTPTATPSSTPTSTTAPFTPTSTPSSTPTSTTAAFTPTSTPSSTPTTAAFTPTSTPSSTATPTTPAFTPTSTPSSTPTTAAFTPTSTPSPGTDLTAPTVTITNPKNGANVKRSSKVTIKANATDNVGVVKVEFLVNTSLLCTDTVAPYNCVWNVPPQTGWYNLTARAHDAAGNVNSHTITVNVK